ncbi:hypothetical protein [Microcoleus sp. K4-C2]|uniref:hypothetical protein n=1 Tax=Microcoleus sp. K4-C2 TaxID=2818792 RepID=UPI002FD287EB
MSRKETLSEQRRKLYTTREWIVDKVFREEGDKLTRDALFKSQKAIGYALLMLEEVEYRTDGAYDRDG